MILISFKTQFKVVGNKRFGIGERSAPIVPKESTVLDDPVATVFPAIESFTIKQGYKAGVLVFRMDDQGEEERQQDEERGVFHEIQFLVVSR